MISLFLALSLAADPVTRCAPGAAADALAEGRAIQKEKGEGGADEAISKYQVALEKDPHCASALWELGWSDQAKGDWEGVLAAWDKLKALDSTYPELAEQYPLAKQRQEQANQLKANPQPAIFLRATPSPVPERWCTWPRWAT